MSSNNLNQNIRHNLFIISNDIRQLIMIMMMQILTYYHPNSMEKAIKTIQNIERVSLPIPHHFFKIECIGIVYSDSFLFTTCSFQRYPLRQLYNFKRITGVGKKKMLVCRNFSPLPGKMKCNQILEPTRDDYYRKICPECKMFLIYYD